MTHTPAYRILVRALIASAVVLLAAAGTWAYEDYSGTGTENCYSCHGNFRSNPYTSLSDGQDWGDDLHDIHRRTMLNSDCNTCHSSGGFSPVRIDSSTGGTGLAAISCVGCHGADPDDTGPLVPTGTGLRQHHYRSGETICLNCHTDADPGSGAPVAGEDVKPPYYTTAAGADTAHPLMPYDPCSPGTIFNENFAGLTIALDNDGDLVYDEVDSDCIVSTATPGETAGPLATDWLRVGKDLVVADRLNLTYGTTCSVTTNRIEFGAFGDLGDPLAYAGQECNIGAGGTFDWDYATNPDIPTSSFFFLIVGNDGVNEGSYGIAGGVERDPDSTSTTCTSVTQSLVDRCD